MGTACGVKVFLCRGRFHGFGGALRLAGACSLALLACAPEPPPRFEHLVLVSIDTLRRDRLGFYGYPRDTSPFLDFLARDGVVFERAYAPMPTTAPSHATLFTALQPLQHGLRTNGHRLPAQLETLAERLAAAGFTTAGFTSTRAQWIPTGLDRGFGVFEARAADDTEVYRPADRTVDAALAWLERCGACERLFLFVHLFDPHGPLRPPEAHLDVFRAEDPEARVRHAAYLDRELGIPLGFYRDDPGRMLFVADRYDAEIRFADAELRRLHAGVSRRLGQGRGSGSVLWVFTSDHGEGLGSHAFMGHGKAYEEGLRVPLLFSASDGSLPRRRVQGIVQHVDLAPTLLALLSQGELAGVEGRSLEAALLGRGATPNRPAFAQRGHIAVRGIRLLPQEQLGDVSGEQFAWIEERFKLLQHSSGAEELYDLRADPHERHNLLEEGEAPQARRLREALAAHLAELSAEARTPEAPELDAQTREELRALGYVP